MDQIKIGAFLKTLRKEKNLTQEQEGKEFDTGASSGTVGRFQPNGLPLGDRNEYA